MESMLSRTELLIGIDGIKKIKKERIVIFGIGGVGSYVSEGLVRSGFCDIILIDGDIISESNINRQVHATTKTIGKYKVDAMKQRLLEINPNIMVKTYNKDFNSKVNQAEIEKLIRDRTYIVDAIDAILSKISIIELANKLDIPIISAMGIGNRINPMDLVVKDVFETKNCPLARIIRKDLKKRNIKKLKVITSNENVYKEKSEDITIGSVSFVPPVAGFIIVSEIVKEVIKKRD